MEMIAHCRKQQEIWGQSDAMVVFKQPGGMGKNRTKRLFGKSGPKGESLQELPGNKTAVAYKADEVIASIEKRLKEME
jgi:hypothetical protein